MRNSVRLASFAVASAGCVVVLGTGAIGALPHCCAVRSTLGVPCPGCGTLTAFQQLVRGEVVAAHATQPAVSLVAAWLVVGVAGMTLDRRFCGPAAGWLASAAGLALVVVWLARLCSCPVVFS